MNATGDLATLARVGASLVVVVVLAALAARLARRAGARGPGLGLRVLDRAGLSREAAVAVVEVAGRGLVLGVTARAVSVLVELAPEELSAAQAEPRPGRPLPRAARPASGSPAVGSPAVGSQAVASQAAPRGSGAILDPRTWRQGIDALREMTVRRG